MTSQIAVAAEVSCRIAARIAAFPTETPEERQWLVP